MLANDFPPHHLVPPYFPKENLSTTLPHQPALRFVWLNGDLKTQKNQENISSRLGSVWKKAGVGGGGSATFFVEFSWMKIFLMWSNIGQYIFLKYNMYLYKHIVSIIYVNISR